MPPFVKDKPQEEWTQDELKQFQAYEQRVKELNEERDKLRKVFDYENYENNLSMFKSR